MESTPLPISLSAPGNMILMGEYAVLHGAPAVLMTLKHRLTVSVQRNDRLMLESDKFGLWEGENDIPQHVSLCMNVLKSCGIDPKIKIKIESDIPPTYGFGSSAALIAALVKAVFRLQGRVEDFRPMFEAGHRAILDTFGRGSGADLAAALADERYIVFDPLQKTVKPFDMPFTVQAIYIGYKTPTPQVLADIERSIDQDYYKALIGKMTECVTHFIETPSAQAIEKYQSYMEDLGVACSAINEAITLFQAAGAHAKISGSGRGDCVAGFTSAPVDVYAESPFVFLSSNALCAE